MAKPAKPRQPSSRLKERAAGIHERLSKAIPQPHVELKFADPWELLLAVILSAQSTDRMVNRVLPELLARWPTPSALASAPSEKVEEVIRPTGFFRNKTKSICGASRAIATQHGGKVPDRMEDLLELPGVARKTANVVLGAAFGVPSGITVDTHASRVSGRLGLTKETHPAKIETALCALFPQHTWILTGHRFVLHGRYVCTARAPRCLECPLNELCPAHLAPPERTWQQRAAAEAKEMESRAEGFVPADKHLR